MRDALHTHPEITPIPLWKEPGPGFSNIACARSRHGVARIKAITESPVCKELMNRERILFMSLPCLSHLLLSPDLFIKTRSESQQHDHTAAPGSARRTSGGIRTN